MTTSIQHHPLTIGKYLITPLTTGLEDGMFACSVSIRSGRGTATTDRVMRFVPQFTDRASAANYARSEGLQWIGQPDHTAAL